LRGKAWATGSSVESVCSNDETKLWSHVWCALFCPFSSSWYALDIIKGSKGSIPHEGVRPVSCLEQCRFASPAEWHSDRPRQPDCTVMPQSPVLQSCWILPSTCEVHTYSEDICYRKRINDVVQGFHLGDAIRLDGEEAPTNCLHETAQAPILFTSTRDDVLLSTAS
jgi:hypothetical protein